jgi:hypothetical protein
MLVGRTDPDLIAAHPYAQEASVVRHPTASTDHVARNFLARSTTNLGRNRVELALWYEALRHEIPAHILLPRNDAPVAVPKTPSIAGR